MYANKDEQEYFKNKKIYTKPDPADNKYKRQIPSYFRILDDPSNTIFPHEYINNYRELEDNH